MSIDDSYTTLIRKKYKTTDKIAPLKEIVIIHKKFMKKNTKKYDLIDKLVDNGKNK